MVLLRGGGGGGTVRVTIYKPMREQLVGSQIQKMEKLEKRSDLLELFSSVLAEH